MEETRFNESVEHIKMEISKRSPNLIISRVPKNTLDRFFTLCSDDEFCNDRGFALKFLLDFYYGLVPNGFEVINTEIASLRAELDLLKGKQQTEHKEKIRTTLSGTKIGGIENGVIKQTSG